MHVLAVLHDRHVRRGLGRVYILAAGGANVPRWLGRQLFASDDFLLEQRWCVCQLKLAAAQHTHALTALCVHTQISMASTHNAP